MLSFRRLFRPIILPALLLSLTQATPFHAQTKTHLTLEDILPPEVNAETALSPDVRLIPSYSVLPRLATNVNTTSSGRSISATPFRTGTVPTF
jgi:hypothetical protein